MEHPADPDFFHSRGIPDEIWQARPYLYWRTDDFDHAKAHFADLNPYQRAFATKIMGQSDGWLIVRHAPPIWPAVPPIYPELRPLEPVRTRGPITHWHGDGPAPADLAWHERFTGNPQPHIDRGKKKQGGPDDHRGTNTEDRHSHQPRAKYVFVPSPKMDGAYIHEHGTRTRPAHLDRHVREDIDPTGRHVHEGRRVKDPMAPDMARRLDLHPLALRPLREAPVVFFVIEGCIKADAVLANGGAVFSVPSVSLWDCAELPDFAATYLWDKVVVIVPDADWIDNPAVINQGRMAQIRLRRLGVPETHVAAPPREHQGRPTKGVDDFLGAGGCLEDLLVIGNEVPPGLHAYFDRLSFRSDRIRRDEDVALALAMYTDAAGEFVAPLHTLARVIGRNKMSVTRAIRDLEGLGAITVDGDLDIRRNWIPAGDRGGWFSHEWDWRKRPTITLIPELRSIQRDEQRLGDVLHLPLRGLGELCA